MNLIKPIIAACCSLTMSAYTLLGQTPLIIPKPVSMQTYEGAFQLPSKLKFQIKGISSKQDIQDIEFLLKSKLPSKVSLQRGSGKCAINLELDSSWKGAAEAYKLEVKQGVTLKAGTIEGLKNGLQTLGQLYDGKQSLAQVLIEDAPSYAYRGVMLDVSRHFFPVPVIKGLLDEMAKLKLNRFHWHLVDGGGWRLESKTYPKLTELSAYRTESNWDKWWGGRDRRFVPKGSEAAYGGYYTQEEIKDVVAYASRLGITIIPEIELPGHSNELFFSYPNLFCPGADYKQATDVCIGNEETFTFFENILDEVMALFPSRDIHIGGDEASMDLWKKCPKCAQRMQSIGTTDVHALQSYMIHRIEKYLNSKGRNLVGWDEILMGGLAPNATVMSWRGEEGGITAAKAGHRVIMTPGSHLYLDFYQGKASEEPRAIGGFTPLEKVYSYAPPAITNSKGGIIGVQANLWTEYVETPEHLSYMLFPRIVALSEVAWTPKEKRDYKDFLTRVTPYLGQLKQRGQHPYELRGLNPKAEVVMRDGKPQMNLRLEAERPDAEVRFNWIGGSTEDSHNTRTLRAGQVISSDGSSRMITANTYLNGKKLHDEDLQFRLGVHKGILGKVHYNSKWNDKYKANQGATLNDGIDGGLTYLDGKWQGFTEPMDVTVELPQTQDVREVTMRFLAEREQWVYMPSDVEVLISSDGKNFTSLGLKKPLTDENNPRPTIETFTFKPNQKARYIRVKANIGRSEGHFIFCDEIVIL